MAIGDFAEGSSKTAIFRFIQSIDAAFGQEQQQWFLWVPVSLALGISIYFSLLYEPSWALTLSIMIVGTGFALVGYKSTIGLVVSGVIFWSALGFTISKVRTGYMTAPVISKMGHMVTLTGWPEDIQKQAKGGVKVTFFVYSMIQKNGHKISHQQTPYRVRIAVRQSNAVLKVGRFTKVRAILHPPPQPVWPGGFDYARKLWFSAIGGVGFAISLPEILTSNPEYSKIYTPFQIRWQASLGRLREHIKVIIRDTIPGKFAPIAIALITGDRSGIDVKDLEALRDSGLAHVLAISGLHMAIMAGTIYFLLRWFLAAFPFIALHYPIRTIAAVAALLGGALYLMISGGAVSTQRAFIMAAVMFIAIILNRPGVTLRNVAFAALIILLLRPESLLDVGFQMSFAAVAALVAIYEAIALDRERKKQEGRILRRPTIFPVRYLGGVASTTLVAGLAVAPVAAYHFHKVSQFSLLGNLLAMPVIGIVIMPMGLLTFLAMPFDLEFIPLYIMQWGLALLMEIAEYVSSLPGAVRPVQQMPALSLILMVFGGLWLITWKKWWRFYGVFLVGAGLAVMPGFSFPDIIVDREGRVVAVKQSDGTLAVPNRRGGEFSLRKWLQIYGESRTVKEARSTKVFRCDHSGCVAHVKDMMVSFIHHPSAFQEDCQKADILISALYIKRSCPSAKVVIDKRQLRDFGAHALYINGNHIVVDNVYSHRPARPWSVKPKNGTKIYNVQ